MLAAVSERQAITLVRDSLVSFHRGDWTMPPKVYLQSPPFGDFRAMPALGDGLASLKWITSFPGQPRNAACRRSRASSAFPTRPTAAR